MTEFVYEHTKGKKRRIAVCLNDTELKKLSKSQLLQLASGRWASNVSLYYGSRAIKFLDDGSFGQFVDGEDYREGRFSIEDPNE
jgi:hypothetical protein